MLRHIFKKNFRKNMYDINKKYIHLLNKNFKQEYGLHIGGKEYFNNNEKIFIENPANKTNITLIKSATKENPITVALLLLTVNPDHSEVTLEI